MMQITELRTLLSQGSNDVCLSGGAKGADRLFGTWSTANNHDQIHFSFEGHGCGNARSHACVLDEKQINTALIRDMLFEANITLGRQVPGTHTYPFKLLARNAWQIYATDKVYAMGTLVSPSLLDGGTAWAVQMYINLCKDKKIPAVVYVYDIVYKTVYMYDNSTKTFEPCTSVPKPCGIWTGIGSRKATEDDLKQFEKYFI